jgi:hypothetical protein
VGKVDTLQIRRVPQDFQNATEVSRTEIGLVLLVLMQADAVECKVSQWKLLRVLLRDLVNWAERLWEKRGKITEAVSSILATSPPLLIYPVVGRRCKERKDDTANELEEKSLSRTVRF